MRPVMGYFVKNIDRKIIIAKNEGNNKASSSALNLRGGKQLARRKMMVQTRTSKRLDPIDDETAMLPCP